MRMYLSFKIITLLLFANQSFPGMEPRDGPRLDPQRPFGQYNLFSQLDATFLPEITTDIDKAKYYVSMLEALNYFTENAVLEEGEYSLKNLTYSDISKLMQGYYHSGSELTAKELGFNHEGKIVITSDILKIIKGTYWEWSNSWENEELINNGYWPSVSIDPKRPYGDMTYIELDMHMILERPVIKRNKDGYIELTDDQENKLSLIHFRLLASMQTFLENARISPNN